MTTISPEVEALARQIAANAGIDREAAVAEAQIKLRYDRAQAAQTAAATVEAAPPAQPAFTWTRYDDIDRRAEAQMDRDMDPQRAARAARERERIEAQMRPLAEQRDALNKQIAALNVEWHRWQ
jgi:hypothetical protein